jgi:hypothetical protein
VGVACEVGVMENGRVIVDIAVASPADGSADSSMEIPDITASCHARDWAGERSVGAMLKEEISVSGCFLCCIFMRLVCPWVGYRKPNQIFDIRTLAR